MITISNGNFARAPDMRPGISRPFVARGWAPGENPHIPSFHHSFKADVVHGRGFQTIDVLRSISSSTPAAGGAVIAVRPGSPSWPSA